ncbi:Pre-mRNA-splicing factor brr2 [Tolypocladium ophioglossoides CBS 100239]|uniref:Pre-mRNA-splicing factor brr2 n=1 Tax=Tolypocladium ophioglossoides (strain CBS 100239) TaxID=1163406 RepID=A0A0L0N7X8_TOLOC|nr:Pre-mRNA-splicing factor brr2 [Tolypocladium ophioglossoides CBS 100239]
MSDPHRDVSQYKYSAMSNLVLQADRRFVTRRTDEATGDPESLAGRLSIKDMGGRVAREEVPKQKKQPGLPDIERGKLKDGEDILIREQRKRKAEVSQPRGTGLLGAHDALIEGITYRPRTPATRATFDLILTLVAGNLGDVPHEVVRSAADAVLEYLKDDDMKDLDKKKEVDDILGAALSDANGEAEMDERQGVAVTFDDEEEEGNDEVVHEVHEESSEDEAGDQDDGENPNATEADGAGTDNEDAALKADGLGAKSKDVDARSIPARDVDAFWLQRQIGTLYPDAHEQTDKTKAALQILSGQPDVTDGEEKSLREIENDLMELFDSEHHELVQKLVANREKVYWLTKLARAETAEQRANVERGIASEGQQRILNELRGEGAGDDDKKRKMDIKMDIDVPASLVADNSKPKQPEGYLVGGLQPRKLINLDNLVFDQGNHLMTNPKVRLPEGSTKRTFKGYEEIHVPPPKKRNEPDDILIPITDMPEWARGPFSTAKSLNKIQ